MSNRLIIIFFDEENGNKLKQLKDGETINLSLPQYADDSEAKSVGSLVAGDWYQDNNGIVRIIQP